MRENRANPAPFERRRITVDFRRIRILALETLHITDFHPVLEILDLPLRVIIPDIGNHLARKRFLIPIDFHLVVLPGIAARKTPFDICPVEVVDFISCRTSVHTDRTAPPGASQRSHIVLHQILRNDLVVPRVRVTGKNQRVVRSENVVNSLTVTHHIGYVTEIEIISCPVPFTQSRRDVQRDDHLFVLSDIREILFHPRELLLSEIAYVIPVLSDIEIVVENNVVNLSDVKRII